MSKPQSLAALALALDACEDAYDFGVIEGRDQEYLRALRLSLDAMLEARRIGKTQ